MKRMFGAAAAAAALAGSIMLSSAPAYATTWQPPVAQLFVKPHATFPGGAFWVSARCSVFKANPVISSALLRKPVVLPSGGKTRFLKITVSPWTVPGKYSILLRCIVWRQVWWHGKCIWKPCNVGSAVQWVFVLRRQHHRRVRPVVVNTGFGGMAPSVATHHPAS